MKITDCILTTLMVIAVFTACKKDEEKEPEQPVNEFAHTFLVEKTITQDFSGYTFHYDFEYDSLNRIIVSEGLRFFYNTNGTLRRLEDNNGNYVDFQHDNNNRIDKAIVFSYPIDSPDTIHFFYSTRNKPDSLYHQLFDFRERIHYDVNEFVKRIDLSHPDFSAYTLYEYQNGNLIKTEEEQNIYDLEYDDKPNVGLAMHLPLEYRLATELRISVDFGLDIIMQNNLIKQTHTIAQEEPYSQNYQVLEYNEAGLPIKVKAPDSTIEYVYEER